MLWQRMQILLQMYIIDQERPCHLPFSGLLKNFLHHYCYHHHRREIANKWRVNALSVAMMLIIKTLIKAWCIKERSLSVVYVPMPAHGLTISHYICDKNMEYNIEIWNYNLFYKWLVIFHTFFIKLNTLINLHTHTKYLML